MSDSLSGGGPVAPAPTTSATPSGEAPQASTPPAQSVVPDFKATKHKVKINGTESEIPYEELVRGYQTTQAAQQRFQEAQKLAANAAQIEKALEAGDFKFIAQKLGPERARKLSEEYLIEQLQEEALPQHEKDLRSERQKREELEKQLKERDQAVERERYQQLADQAYQDLDNELSEALKAVGKQPNPRLALRMIEQIEAEMKASGVKIPAAKAWEKARRGIQEDIALIAPEMSYQEARELFGAKVLDRWMSEKVGQVMDRQSKPQAPRKVSGSDEQVSDEGRPLSLEEKFARIEKNIIKRR